jgi:alkanesulfonate monooxygenase SsuD/methylene tetrahydromethanopterin reductase-like flavin-dependent oxidoreductase (luciferase family)
MRLGAQLMLGASDPQPRDLAELARRFVGEGFESLWVGHGLGRGFMIHDPIVALSVFATVTDGVELGTAIVQLPLFDSADFAFRVMGLQQLCGDRLRLGIGAGSSRPDFTATGRDYEQRFAQFAVSQKELREIYATGRARGVDLTPWPSVAKLPPMLLGTWGAGVEKAAREFDGWIASAGYRPVDEVVANLKRYRAAGGSRAIAATIQIKSRDDLPPTQQLLQRLDEAGFDDALVICWPGAPGPREVRALLK